MNREMNIERQTIAIEYYNQKEIQENLIWFAEQFQFWSHVEINCIKPGLLKRFILYEEVYAPKNNDKRGFKPEEIVYANWDCLN